MNGLFVTSAKISWHGPDSLIKEDRQGDLFSDLHRFFTSHLSEQPPEEHRVDLVLDHSLYHFQTLTLPYMRQGKAAQVLGFELENLMVVPVEQLNHPFQIHSDKAAGFTQLAVFGIEKPWLEQLKELLASYQLELHRLYSLENLLLAQSGVGPRDQISVHQDSGVLRVIFTKNGLIEAVSQFHTTGEITAESAVQWCVQLNRRIGAAEVFGEQRPVHFGHSAQGLFQSPEFGPVEPNPKFQPPKDEEEDFSNLLTPAFLKQKSILPLQTAPAAWLAELQKYRSPLKKLGISASVLVLLWASWIGLGLFQGQQQASALQKKYRSVLSRYAPGLSPVNGLSVLQDKVDALRALAGRQRQTKAYGYSQDLANISAIKKTATSLTLSRLSAKDGDWTLVGETESNQDFEATKEALKKLFSAKDYSMTVSQKAQGEGKVNFTISLLLKGRS